MRRRCHRGVTLQSPLLGLDPAVTVVALVGFAAGAELAGPVLGAALAAGAALCIALLRRRRLPGYLKALATYLRWSAVHPVRVREEPLPPFPLD